MRIALLIALTACTASHPPRDTAPANATRDATRWTYRVYSSGIESNQENITTVVVDEVARTVESTVMSREGRERDHVPWGEPAVTRWKLAVARTPAMELVLTAADGTASRYACTLQPVDIAPATAVRVFDPRDEGAWHAHWSEATRKLSVQICRTEDSPSGAPPELLLANEPIEHLVADQDCCVDALSLRLIPADGSVVPPRDPRFPESQ